MDKRLNGADLERLLDAISDGLVILDSRWTITYVNRYAAALWGKTPSELIGGSLWHHFSEAVGSPLQQHLFAVAESGEPAEFEARSPRTGRWLRAHAYPAPDALIVYFADVTLTRQTTTRVETEHAITRVLADTSSIEEAAPRLIDAVCNKLDMHAGGLWLPSPADGRLHCCEFRCVGLTDTSHPLEARCMATSFSPGEGLPGRVWQARAPTWIADLAKDTNFSRVSKPEDGLRSGFAFPITIGDDFVGVLEFFATRPLDVREPMLEMMASMGSEIGQFVRRWEAQQALHSEEVVRAAVLETALDCIIIMDESGCILEFNPAAENTFGYRRDDVIGEYLADCIVPPDLREAHRLGLERFFEAGEGPLLGRRIEVEAMRADQSTFPCELSITHAGTRGAGAKVEASIFVGYVRDITARKEDEQRLIDALERAEQMTRLKTSLLANMSHEIRTPLTSLMTWTTLLHETSDDHDLTPMQERAMTTIERSAQRLADTLDSVLALAQLEGQALEPELEVMSVDEAAREAVNEFQPRAMKKDLSLTLSAPNEHTFARVDPTFLRRIFNNLLSNAIKFTEEGGVSVEIIDNADTVSISVRDTGIGIKPGFLSRLFNDFEQESTGFARTHEGTGLGMAITKRLVDAMNGEISVASEKGSGTTFTVTFPRAEVADEPLGGDRMPPENRSAAELARLDARVNTRKPRVLLVEDNDDIREATAGALASMAHVEAFETAELALARAVEVRFDLVLMDISLPGMDGLEARAQLREQPEYTDTPVIAMTGHAMVGDRQYLLRRGFTDYLAKPFKLKALVSLVDEWLSSTSMELSASS